MVINQGSGHKTLHRIKPAILSPAFQKKVKTFKAKKGKRGKNRKERKGKARKYLQTRKELPTAENWQGV